MRVYMMGFRGFPGVQGGIETHCMELSTRLVKLGCEVIAFSRPPYANADVTEFQGVRIVPIRSPQAASLELIGHTWSCLNYVRRHEPGIVHLHGIGASLFTGYARRLAPGTVVTIHSISYLQDKWGRLAKAALRRGEAEAARHADELIAVSPLIQSRHPRASLIPNGVSPLFFDHQRAHWRQKPYVLAVGRINADKGIPELLQAWQMLPEDVRCHFDLVVVGSPAPQDAAAQQLVEHASQDPTVHFVGSQPLEEVSSLMTGAALFVHPSHYEGHPISVVEALAAGVNVLTSDIPEIMALDSPTIRTFPVRNVEALRDGILQGLRHPLSEKVREQEVERMASLYDWNALAARTLEVYRSALAKNSRSRG